MEIIKWRNSFATGVEQFDNEHKQLFVLINRLHDGLVSGAESEVLLEVLGELTGYTRKHFEHEEKYMRRFLYPERAVHVKEHDSFRNTIEDIVSMATNGVEGLGLPVLKLMRSWLLGHIVESDGKYGAHFNEKGVF